MNADFGMDMQKRAPACSGKPRHGCSRSGSCIQILYQTGSVQTVAMENNATKARTDPDFWKDVIVLTLPGPRSCSCLSALSEELIGYSQPSDGARCPSLGPDCHCVLGLRSVVAGLKRRPSVPGSRLASPARSIQ